MRQRAVRVLEVEPDRADRAHGGRDLPGDGLGRTGVQRAGRSRFVLEVLAAHGPPPALAADAIDEHLVVRPERVERLGVGVGDVTRRVDRNRLGGVAELLERASVEVGERSEAGGTSTDDGEHERQPVVRGTHDRLGAAADPHPGPQSTVLDRRVDELVGERSAQLAAPGDRLLREERCEEVELLLEELLVLVQLESEEREGLDERPAAEDHLGASVRECVEGREALEDPDGIVGAQDRDGGSEADPLRAPGDRCEHHLRRRDGELVTVMLADAEEVEPQPIRELGFRHHVAQHLRVWERSAVGPCGHIAEGVEPELIPDHLVPPPAPAYGRM